MTGTNPTCDCDGNQARRGCFNSATMTGRFSAIDDIFQTTDGRDARQLRFARYVGGMERSPTTTPVGTSVPTSGAQSCATCTPTNCASYQGFNTAKTYGAVQPYADALDWKWVQFYSYNPNTGAAASGTNNPATTLVYDLGSAANQVVLFPIRDNSGDGCVQPLEFDVWLSDNPNAQTTGTDSNHWNEATLVRAFTDGWTDNPNSLGVITDTSNLRDTTNGIAIADGVTTVWQLPPGRAYRYVAISPTNPGNPSGSCHFDTDNLRLDAVAGLDANGNSLSIVHVLPYGSTAGPDAITASTLMKSADVYLLMDTTAGMEGELSNLQTDFSAGTFVSGCTGGVVAGLRCLIPDVQFGIGDLREYPVYPWGYAPSYPFRHGVDITTNATLVQSALSAFTTQANYDTPEAQTSALWSLATGNGISGTWVSTASGTLMGGTYTYVAARAASCASGGRGYPCFRATATPIVVMATDAPFHNGPSNSRPYDDGQLFDSPITYPAAVAVTGNDLTAGAFTLSETATFVGTGSTTGFASNNSGSCRTSGSNSPDAVFQVTLTTARSVHIDTIGSTLSTALYITPAAGGAEVACNAAANLFTTQSEIDTVLPAGSYYIWVDGATDASNGSYTFRWAPREVPAGHAPTFAEAVAALNAIGAKLIILNSGDATAHADHAALATATGSTNSSGGAAVFDTNASGSNIGSDLIDAISNFTGSARQDITAVAQDNPATAFDERLFIANPTGTPVGTVRLSNTAAGEPAPYPTNTCVNPAGTSPGGIPIRANQCPAGTQVNFRADFRNNAVMSTGVTQTFTFDIVVYANGVTELSRIPVTIIVPPGSFPHTGTFTYDVDASTSCPAGQLPQWYQVQFDATTPAGTSIQVQAQTAPLATGLAAAPLINLGTVPPTVSPIALSPALIAGGQSDKLPFLRVTFTLTSDPTSTITPTLSGYRVLFNCVDAT
jgi:hypothetical protein